MTKDWIIGFRFSQITGYFRLRYDQLLLKARREFVVREQKCRNAMPIAPVHAKVHVCNSRVGSFVSSGCDV